MKNNEENAECEVTLVEEVIQKRQWEIDSKSTICQVKNTTQNKKLEAGLFPCFLYTETRRSK